MLGAGVRRLDAAWLAMATLRYLMMDPVATCCARARACDMLATCASAGYAACGMAAAV
jgi:hypothetical protein